MKFFNTISLPLLNYDSWVLILHRESESEISFLSLYLKYLFVIVGKITETSNSPKTQLIFPLFFQTINYFKAALLMCDVQSKTSEVIVQLKAFT